ncbi:MAG: hypothetical protein H7338_13465 [Candidatus Sericytochromatia bacterium]|nr:hypothetical protein [Candidatus Sericytochromatia bacterium]
MRKLLIAALSLLPTLAWAQAAPIPHQMSVDDLQIVTAAVTDEPSIVVGSPNDPKASRKVTPFRLAPDLDTTLVWLQIRNTGRDAVDVPYRRLRLIYPNPLNSRSAMGLTDLKGPWGRYLSWAVAPPAGNPMFFEQEIANQAERFLNTKLFPGGTIPPGGNKEGYVAFAKSEAVTRAVLLEMEVQQGERARSVTSPVAQ